MRKILSLLLVAFLLVVLVSCKAGVLSSELELDPVTQQGTAKFTIRVPKNDAPDTGNNFDKPGDPGYISSPEDLLNLFKKAVPAGYTVTMKDEPKMVEREDGSEVDQGDFAYTLTFTFNGIDDYNNKVLKLVGQSSWDAASEHAGVTIPKATLTVTPNGDKYDVTFTEDVRILDVVGYWAYKTLTSDTTGVWNDVYGETYPDYPVTFDNTINLDLATYTINFGGNTQTYRHSDGLVTLTATVDEVKTGDGGNSGNPQTGDASVLPLLLAAAASAGGLLVLRKRK
ncbi:MAG TPA: LPXTG cell wall anchor domain-containing protein [Candidatus Atribacteria bacterium]|nr:LPXTG cell wall anchor domain-containing protein [Candidatus Atribacteria bacterium]HPT79301.1 LPXTG cell wall anchor domain-containing protein [Candidatus Atribacteria bacterium]